MFTKKLNMSSLTVLRTVDVSGDGGIVKHVYREGEGDETPQSGDKVEAHYTGTLENGEKFDSSRDRGTVFKFDIGQGRVIKGWDQGVSGMQVGGSRTIIIPSDMGYGSRGAGNVIPPNSDLIFDVELIEIQ